MSCAMDRHSLQDAPADYICSVCYMRTLHADGETYSYLFICRCFLAGLPDAYYYPVPHYSRLYFHLHCASNHNRCHQDINPAKLKYPPSSCSSFFLHFFFFSFPSANLKAHNTVHPGVLFESPVSYINPPLPSFFLSSSFDRQALTSPQPNPQRDPFTRLEKFVIYVLNDSLTPDAWP